MRKYELIPTNGSKSFYGKAIVQVNDSGDHGKGRGKRGVLGSCGRRP